MISRKFSPPLEQREGGLRFARAAEVVCASASTVHRIHPDLAREG